MREIQHLGNHGEEASQKITELEALCKQKEDAAKKLMEEKAKLEGMIQSRDELIMEMADEYGLNRMGEDADNEDEDEDDDGGDTAAPPAAAPPTPTHEVIVIEEEDPVEIVPKQEAVEAHEVILVDAEAELLQPRLFTVIMRDYEESPSRMMDDLDDLDDSTEADYDVDEWFPEDGSNDRD
jgi:hypothetical protein